MVENIVLALLFGGMFTLVFGGVGVFMLNRYRTARREAGQSVDWPSTPGRIVESSITTSIPDRRIDNTRSTTYAPSVEYIYTVQDVEYHGKRIGFGDVIKSTRHEADAVIQHYFKNAMVSVYYNPQNPAEAVLEKKVGSQSGFLVLVIVFLLLGLISCGVSLWAIISQFIE